MLELDPHGSEHELHLHPLPSLPGLTFHNLHFLTKDSKENRAPRWYLMEICAKLVKIHHHACQMPGTRPLQ